jgi:hypothetical protein
LATHGVLLSTRLASDDRRDFGSRFMRRLLTTAGAAIALSAASTAHAAAAPRMAAPVKNVSEIGGGSETLIIVLAAVFAGALQLLAVDDHSDSP